jgi:hypothetical protein
MPVTSSRAVASVRQPVELDVQVLGRVVDATKVQDFAQSDG